MIKRISIAILSVSFILISGCIKETYDMNKLSGDIHISPSLAIPGIKGNVTFKDLVKPSDTVVFDQNNFVKLVFREDSVINFQLSDFYDLDNMISFSQSYQLGVLSIGSFQGSLSVTLNQITQNIVPTSLKNQIRALDDGSTHLFPPFPSVNLGEQTFTAFPNFDNAVFQSGYLDISVVNNLTTPLSGISMNLLNSTDRTAIGTVTIPPVQPGQTQTASVDLTNKKVTSNVIAAIVLSGSAGTSTPVIISLNNSNIQVTARGRDLKIKSGKIVLPTQNISTLDNKDTISFDAGLGIELDEIKIASGSLSYTLKSGTTLAASVSLTLPTVIRGGIPVTHTITTGTGNLYTGNVSFSGTTIDLGSDPTHPFNRIPLQYSIQVGSNGVLINYNSTDKIQIDLSLVRPQFDYVKGFFGQISESIETNTLDLDIDDILSHISGTFLISSPSIKLNYSNSFAIPVKIDFQVAGERGKDTVNLGLDPITILSPQYPAARDASSSILIDKNNSNLPELISLPPGKVIFSGSAKMNPDGNNGLRDNYVFGNSRFVGSAEVEVPLEFRMNNLQFNDTIDNFLKVEGDNNPIKPENFDKMQLDLTAINGFPLGVSVKMSLYDSSTKTIKSTVNASSLLGAAKIDNTSGKVTGTTETKTSLVINKEFFDAIKSSDKIIIWFTLNTSSDGAVDVKIYSDYAISFKTTLIFKPEIIF
jgi:hypothetical protein